MNNHTHDLLLIAIVQAQDAEPAQEALEGMGFTAERLPSVGGFLGRRNVTLLIPLDRGQSEAAQNCLHETCRQRVEYIAVPMESAPLPIPSPTPITVGGATIFGLEIDHYEEL
ncbi:MAG: hypothetical protein HPY76_09940 [Anaerolineae bacterium]|nr:hypothetical protein [Anaerolineae bacterium]